MRVIIHCLALISLLISSAVLADTVHLRIDLNKEVWHLHPDMTYEKEITTQATLLTPYAVSKFSTQEESFSPDTERLELLEAYVIQPTGEKIKISEDHIKTRPSPLALSTGGFANSYITTVVFPELKPGSQTFLRWKLTRFKPEKFLGFNIIDTPLFEAEVTRQEVIIHQPNAVNLHWAKFGDYKTTVEKTPNETLIHAWIKDKPAQISEGNMPSPLDFQPVFLASSTQNWKEIGRKYYAISQDKVKLTPEIQTLANQIVGDKKGLEAAQALYDWTAQNIHYISLGLNEAAGYTPHNADEVLKNRYGDCKDYAILLQSLLKAAGIKSYTALINWGNEFRVLPTPSPFQFNHAIIYLPDYHLFANPTDRTASFGVLDLRLSNKIVVIATEQGELAKTPMSSPTKNRYTLKSDIYLKESGDIEGTDIAHFYGSMNNTIRSIDQSSSLKTVAEGILATTPEGGTGNLSISNPYDLDHNMVIKGQWNSLQVYSMNKTLYFSVPYGIDYLSPQSLLQNITYGKRLYPAFTEARTIKWSYQLHLPPHYVVKDLAKDQNFKNLAGSYKSHYQRNKNGIQVTRELIIEKSYYQPGEYTDYNELKFMVARDGRSILVLEKN